ncbi:MAG: helix-turn-helix transcriptional regulator [Bacteroidota bacterium]
MNVSLGGLEETILLIALVMDGEAYAVSIAKAYKERSGKSISIPAVHTVMKRLEKKGMLTSSMGGATDERGGRTKRLYEVTKYGYHTLNELRHFREGLWKEAPGFRFT